MTPIFCLVGPTAVGKTAIAVRILERLNGVIISADARQVYKFLDIGTNKPNEELRRRVAFEMIDIVTPEQAYSAADFARDARTVVARLTAERRPFMLVGGSGLYIRALFEPFFALPRDIETTRPELERLTTHDLYQELSVIDPATAGRLHANDRQRSLRALEVYEATGKTMTQLRAEQRRETEFAPVYLGLNLPRAILYRHIDERFDQMIALGLVEEVRNLMRMGYREETPALNAIGYHEILGFLNGRLTLDAALATAKKRSRAYARRQLTWFRRAPGIKWVDALNQDTAAGDIERLFQDGRDQASFLDPGTES